MGQQPSVLVENTLNTISHVQYHALYVTVPSTANLTKDYLRLLINDCKHPEFPVNLVFLNTATENIPLLNKAFHAAKIQTWYVVTQSIQLTTLTEQFVSQNTDVDGIMFLSNESLPTILAALEDSKINIAQHKSTLRLGCRIPRKNTEDIYQVFNTINLAIITATVTEPLALPQDVGPLLAYAQDVNTIAYIALNDPGTLQQSTPAQLNKYIAYLNSVLENKKYKGFILSDDTLAQVWQNKTSRKN
jgi:hypothetical protein